MDEDKLKRFLVELPSALGFQNSSRVKEYVYKALYFISTNNGQYLLCLFPDLSRIEETDRDKLEGSDFTLEALDKLPSLQKPESKEYSHAIDKPCARLFKAGDLVYRCEECGFDDTCVLCSYCFNEQDHLGHSVLVYTSSGTSGGVCDCGDPEAFVSTLHCKCSAKKAANTFSREAPANTPSYDYLYQTIKLCLDYVLDVTNSNVCTLPIIHEHMNKGLLNFNPRSLSNYFSLPSGKYGGAGDVNSNYWNLILWNDEFHDLGQAIHAIRLGLSCNDNKATQIATKIDKEGYCVLKGASTYEALMKSKELVERGGLVATITSTRDLFRELIVRAIILWLDDILDSYDEQFKLKSQDVLAHLLLGNDYKFAKVFPEEFLRGLTHGTMDECFKNGIPVEDKFVTRFNSNQVRTPISNLDLRERLMFLLAEPELELPFSRFQILLIFQIRFPKLVRKKLVSILLPLLVANLDLKGNFAKQFTEIYPMLLAICAYLDREDHLNLITEISSQLYTCPVTVKKLLEMSYANYIISGLTRIIEESCSVWDEDIGHCIFVDSDTDSQADRRLKRALLRGIHDWGHFSSPSLGQEALQTYLRPKNFVFLVLFLKLFHDYLPMTRKRGEHVQQELITFRLHPAISMPILSSLRDIAASQVGHPNLDWAIEKLANFLAGEEMYRVEYGLDNIKVSMHSHAFVHPLTSFLSYLIQFNGYSVLYPMLEDQSRAIIVLSDASLRSIVLGSQIKIGFWIRNGISASRQASMYFGPIMSDFTFARDVHLQQIALLMGNPEEMVSHFLARWELSDWFSNRVEYTDTIYEERFFSIVERFVGFVYKLLTDRSMFSRLSFKEAELKETRKFLAYYLCEKARNYTKLKTKVDSDICDLPVFDEILYEIADYQPPSSLLGTGLYRLKDSEYKQLDPMGLFLDPSKFQVLYDVLIKKLSKTQNVKEDEVILAPSISLSGYSFVDNEIGAFLKTKFFVKVIHKLLRVAIDSGNESYLPQLLHLIHAIILDDERIHGKDYLAELLVDIPICDLLLTIVESNMSKPVIHKADYLVEQLLVKDQRILENLVSCFGEDYVQSFKKRKTQLFETKAEKDKRISEERKKKIMKKFSKRQEKFLKNNEKLNQEHDQQMEQEGVADAKVCVICGEKEKAGQAFGTFLIATEAPLFWAIDNLFEYDSSKVWSEDLYAYSNKFRFGKGYNIYSKWSHFQKPVFSSCGHGLHYECFKRGVGHTKYYPCPLCRTYHDAFMPFVAHEPSDVQALRKIIFDNTVPELGRSKMDILRDVFVPDNHGIRYSHFLELKSRYVNNFDHWLVGMSNTIQMSEIGTRLNGISGYSDFLRQIPQSSKNLFKALAQAQVVIADLCDPLERKTWENERGYLRNNLEYGDADWLAGGFVETLAQFFTSEQSLATLARKEVSKIISKLMARLSMDWEEAEAFVTPKENRGYEASGFEEFTQLWLASGLPSSLESYMRQMFDLVQQVLGVYLRQVVILQYILLSECDGTYAFDGEIYTKMAEDIKTQPNVFDIAPLTRVLQIPSLAEFFTRIRDPQTLEHREYEMFRNMPLGNYTDRLLALDSPEQVHLCTLPKDYQDGLLKLSEMNVLRKCICMFCGQWISKGQQHIHMQSCSKFGILFDPERNLLRICILVGENSLVLEIPGPYVTKHGEPKGTRTKGKALMNENKLKELNRLWLNQGLYSYVSRPLFGSAPNMMMPNFGILPGVGAGAMDIDDDDGAFWEAGPDDDDEDDEFMFT